MKAEGPRSAGMNCWKAKRTQLLLLLQTAETDGARRQSNLQGDMTVSLSARTADAVSGNKLSVLVTRVYLRNVAARVG